MADNGCLPNMHVRASYFSVASWPPLFFPWSIRGSRMLPPGVYAGSLLPCCPQSSEGNHPWDRSSLRCQGLSIWSLTGQVARSGFVVTEGNLRGTD